MKRLAVLTLAAVVVWGAILVRHHATHTGAPSVGDSCTNNPGGSFSYNDGGPGYVEQTAFGLTCQGPAATATSTTVVPDITTPAPATAAVPAGPPLPIAGDGVVSCIGARCHQAGHETVWPMPDACDHDATWTAAGVDRRTGAALYRCKANAG
jgi:hypothetical protein